MSYCRKKILVISAEEMQEHLAYCRKYRNIVYREKQQNEFMNLNAFVVDKLTWFELTYKKGTQTCTYKCRKDEEEAINKITGEQAYQIAQRYYKAHDFRDDEYVKKTLSYSEEAGKFLCSAKPLLWNNKKFEGKRFKAYSYDINSSYSNAMLKPLPNTDIKYRSGFVEEGEVGFKEDINGSLVPIFTGFSLFIFPLMNSPYNKFVEHWYDNKVKAKDNEAKQKAKDTLNLPIGYFQKTNPFMRAMIIYYANEEIKSHIDLEHTAYCNTDSIVSDIPLSLNVGTDIGQYKLEDKGTEFAFIGFNYQWDYKVPHYRSKPHSWFKDGWDILKDKLPVEGNIYAYNKNTCRLELIKYEA